MSKGLIIFITVVVILGGCLANLWGHYKKAEKLDNRIEAKHETNKSNYDSMWKTLTEMVQIPEMKRDHMKDIYIGLMEKRYSDNNLLFKSIKEDNPDFDDTLYEKIMDQIVLGRKTFDNYQKQMTDFVREYNDYIVGKIFLTSFTDHEKKKISDYIVTSDRTENAFETQKDEPLDLLGKDKK